MDGAVLEDKHILGGFGVDMVFEVLDNNDALLLGFLSLFFLTTRTYMDRIALGIQPARWWAS